MYENYGLLKVTANQKVKIINFRQFLKYMLKFSQN